MALIITSNDITYKNIVGVNPSIYVVINPNFEYTKHNGVSLIQCRIDVYKDKSTYDDQTLKHLMKLDIKHISPLINLSFLTKETLEQDIHDSLKAILIERHPDWDGKIQIVDLEYQVNP
jgi:hypothetical protein